MDIGKSEVWGGFVCMDLSSATSDLLVLPVLTMTLDPFEVWALAHVEGWLRPETTRVRLVPWDPSLRSDWIDLVEAHKPIFILLTGGALQRRGGKEE